MLEPLPSSSQAFTVVGLLGFVQVALAAVLTGVLWRYLLPDWLVVVAFLVVVLALVPVFKPLYRRYFPDRPETNIQLERNP